MTLTCHFAARILGTPLGHPDCVRAQLACPVVAEGSDDSRFAVCLDVVVLLRRLGQLHSPHGAPRLDSHVCSPS